MVLGCALQLACGEPRVLVVGLDGANWQVVDPLIDAGYLPNIGRLVREGARAELDCVPADPVAPCFCPPVWTSIATGTPMADHGIVWLTTPSYRRRNVAIWRYAAGLGVRVTTASWRGTWPSERYVEYNLSEPGLDEAAEQLFEVWEPIEHVARQISLPLFEPPNLLQQLALLPGSGPRPPSWAIFARDRVAMEALLELARQRDRVEGEDDSGPPELTMVTLHGPDKVAHLLWGALQDEMYGPFDAQPLLAGAAAWGGPVELPGPVGWGEIASPYLEADAWLGELLSLRDYHYVVLLSDHGMTRNPRAGVAGQHDRFSEEGHRGIFAIHGPGVRQGARLQDVSVLDVAPTLAYLLDLPVAEDLPGAVIDDAFDPAWRVWKPAYGKTVPSWD
jgi:hypothetical protein